MKYDETKNCDCLVCVISTHGEEQGAHNQPHTNVKQYEHFILTKDVWVETNLVLQFFEDDNCPSFKGKPKFIFIQVNVCFNYIFT